MPETEPTETVETVESNKTVAEREQETKDQLNIKIAEGDFCPDSVVYKSEKHTVMIELTDDEVVEMHLKTIKLELDRDKLASQKSLLTAEIKAQDEKIADMKTTCRYRQESRKMECQVRIDYTAILREVFHPITGRVIVSRSLTVDERQLKLDFDKKAIAKHNAETENE